MSPAPAPELSIELAADVAAVGRLDVVSSMLDMICANTGMGFAAVARVTDHHWIACAVHDDIAFGLRPGGQLDLETTLCFESRAALQPVIIDHASLDPLYQHHHTPRLYGIESYISVPIVLPDGEYFGNLCAIDSRPAVVSEPRTVTMFKLFADLIALQLHSGRKQSVAESALLDERATADLREQFIAVLGHDLRNPLAAVGASAELLSRRTHEPDLARIAQRLKTATQRMSRLIDDVLDFARGRMGSGLDISAHPVHDLDIALADVVAELQSAHPDRAIVSDIAALPRLCADKARIQQLLSNLLGNALAHGTPEAPIHVSIRAEDEHLVIAVQNQGAPIPAEYLQRVFEPYWRPAHSKPGGGLGLGLYICSQIVKAHAGRIEVQSQPASGTRFTARLPIRLA